MDVAPEDAPEVVPDVAPVAQQVLAAAAAVVPSLEDVITLLEEDEKTQK